MSNQYLRNIYEAYEKVGGVKEGPRGWCTKYNVPKSTLNKAIRKYSTSQGDDNRKRDYDGRFVQAVNMFAVTSSCNELVGGNLANRNGTTNNKNEKIDNRSDKIKEVDQNKTQLSEMNVHPPSNSFTLFIKEMEK
ncbi:Protein CBG22569 [Caenorhabditis briggsae]|uniref:Protein CBG22568 n=1 Tax=Caenorhabditis briggsae TaxID=6238 RepID=G2J730_CAEBR|nr:Protein CBG22568 [Caenorhabditis briggsae]XP_002649078.1 Protein CBG22569 [Caenorhabditis briggsae]CAP39129.1 Protein CBG22568 [Caenorhabditis briggsae]CAP39130.1 Protein CBG22569 [Caenorhabditis briggsae]